MKKLSLLALGLILPILATSCSGDNNTEFDPFTIGDNLEVISSTEARLIANQAYDNLSYVTSLNKNEKKIVDDTKFYTGSFSSYATNKSSELTSQVTYYSNLIDENSSSKSTVFFGKDSASEDGDKRILSWYGIIGEPANPYYSLLTQTTESYNGIQSTRYGVEEDEFATPEAVSYVWRKQLVKSVTEDYLNLGLSYSDLLTYVKDNQHIIGYSLNTIVTAEPSLITPDKEENSYVKKVTELIVIDFYKDDVLGIGWTVRTVSSRTTTSYLTTADKKESEQPIEVEKEESITSLFYDSTHSESTEVPDFKKTEDIPMAIAQFDFDGMNISYNRSYTLDDNSDFYRHFESFDGHAYYKEQKLSPGFYSFYSGTPETLEGYQQWGYNDIIANKCVNYIVDPNSVPHPDPSIYTHLFYVAQEAKFSFRIVFNADMTSASEFTVAIIGLQEVVMMKRKLLLLIAPLLLTGIAGCSNDDAKKYQAFSEDQQRAIMEQYYNLHKSNQSNLNLYSYKKTDNYNSTYDVFGEMTPTISNYENPTLRQSPTGLHFEDTLTNEVGVYSGYLVSRKNQKTYIGNKENVGSIDDKEKTTSYWFRDFDDSEHVGQKQLIKREADKDNDLDVIYEDVKQEIAVEDGNVSHYFSNTINTTYEDVFVRNLVQPVATEKMQVSAYMRSEAEIVETYKEVTQDDKIQNPKKPGLENALAVSKRTEGETIFKQIENIGWVCTEFKEKITYELPFDYELNILDDPLVIREIITEITFTYSAAVQPYTGEAYVYKEKDAVGISNTPSLYKYGDTTAIIEGSDISAEYRHFREDYSGYAYLVKSVQLEPGEAYSFSRRVDVKDASNYETIGFNELTRNGNDTIVSAGIEGHNLFKTTNSSDTNYEFLILVPSTGSISLIAYISI